MERLRKAFQGVANIIRFNWHFYALSVGGLGLLLFLKTIVPPPLDLFLGIGAVLLAGSVFLSLLTSFYVYDLSNLYTFSWLDFLPTNQPQNVVTIHAGFDETSALLQRKFPSARLFVFDFYDPARHTEVSIRRARKAYPPYPGTKVIDTSVIPLPDQTADLIFLILAAHEIRLDAERVRFFNELRRVLKPSGRIIVVEHLRDGYNFLAYTIGFLHFLPELTWFTTFAKAGLTVGRRFRLTPFVTIFVLQKDGSSP